MNKNITIIYILCPGHSGSTLLNMLLNGHSQITGIGEIYLIGKYAAGRKRLNADQEIFWQSVKQCYEQNIDESFAELNLHAQPLYQEMKGTIRYGLLALYFPVDLMKPYDDATENESSGDAPPRAFAGRVDLLRIAVRSIADHPLSGVGAGNALAIEHFPQTNFYPDYIHNVPLQLAVEVGVAGCVVWLWICVGTTALLLCWRTRLTVWAMVFLCAWAVLAIISMIDGYPWAIESGRLLTVTTLALLQKSLNPAPDTSDALIGVAR